jgi:hypothetical protein
MSAHDDRIRSIQSSMQQATDELVSLLQQLDDAKSMRAPADAWSPAQIGSHVAKTNEFLATVIAGGVAGMEVPKPAEFKESLASLRLPAKVQTFPALEPAAGTTTGDAVAQLKKANDAFAKALPAATDARCSCTCIKMPFGPVFSVYEVGEFAAAHVHRHIGQVKRAVAAA